MFKWLKIRKLQCDITEEQFLNFIKTPKDKDGNISKQTKHYLDYFNKYKATKKIMNWNYSAAFASDSWLFFRKMYSYVFIGLSLGITTSFVLEKILESCGIIEIFLNIFTDIFSHNRYPILDILFVIFAYESIEIIYFIFFGLFGDYLYLNFAVNKIKKGITHKGTHSYWFVISLTAIYLFLLFKYSSWLVR